MRERFRRLRSDRGYALASTVLLSGVVLVMAAFIVTRVVETTSNIAGNRTWENALQTADSGIDYATALFASDPGFTTGHGPLATRDAVVAAAVAVDADDVIRTPGGEFVIIAPTTGTVVYSVGFAPSRGEAERIRVVRAALDRKRWVIDETSAHVLLVGGDLKVEAKKKDKDVEIFGSRDWAHANGDIIFKKNKVEDNVNAGCLTSFGNQYSNEAADSNVACPNDGSVEFVDIPDVNPIDLHYLSQYDVCPGAVRHGPSSPDAGIVRALAGAPCTGDLVFGTRGIKNAESWDKKVEFKDESEEGVYFVWGRSAKIKLDKHEGTRFLTVITAKPGNDLTCDDAPGGVKLGKNRNGDIEIEVKERSTLRPHPAGGPYAAVAAGDLKIKVKGKGNDNDVTDGKDKQGTAYGLYFAHEQVKLESNDAEEPDDYDDEDGFDDLDSNLPKGALRGVLIAQDACDTKGSKVKDLSTLKKGDIVFDPDFAVVTDFRIENGPVAPTIRREI